MESEAAPTPLTQLDDLRKAQVLAHTRYPKLGPWYPPLFGAAAAGWVAAYALPVWGSLLVWVVLGSTAGALMRWYVAKRGAAPNPMQAPAPIKHEMVIYLVGLTILIGAILAAYLAIGWWAGALVAFVGFTIGIAVYERRYAEAAHRAEVEAGITA
ncbi:MAG: hypothetical protein R2733_04515 [Acidimicrobiales bacterium]